MSSLPINKDSLLPTPILCPQHLQPLPHTIRRITDDAIQEPHLTERTMRQIRDEPIDIPIQQPILPEIRPDVLTPFPPHHPAIDIRPYCHGAEMRTRDGETPRPHKGIIKQSMGSSHGDIGGQERELGIHGCGIDVLASLEAVFVQDQARRGGDEAA